MVSLVTATGSAACYLLSSPWQSEPFLPPHFLLPQPDLSSHCCTKKRVGAAAYAVFNRWIMLCTVRSSECYSAVSVTLQSPREAVPQILTSPSPDGERQSFCAAPGIGQRKGAHLFKGQGTWDMQHGAMDCSSHPHTSHQLASWLHPVVLPIPYLVFSLVELAASILCFISVLVCACLCVCVDAWGFRR